MFVEEEKKGNKTKRGFVVIFGDLSQYHQAKHGRLLKKIHIGPFLNIFQKQFDGILFWRLLIEIRNGILLPKLFWPTVRKNCSSDREKLFQDHLNN